MTERIQHEVEWIGYPETWYTGDLIEQRWVKFSGILVVPPQKENEEKHKYGSVQGYMRYTLVDLSFLHLCIWASTLWLYFVRNKINIS